MNNKYEEIPVSSGEVPIQDKEVSTISIVVPLLFEDETMEGGYYDFSGKRWIHPDRGTAQPTSWLRKLPLDVSVARETAIERMIEFINGMLKIEDDLIVKYKDNLSAVADIKTNWQQLNKIKEIALSLQKQQSESPLSSPTGTQEDRGNEEKEAIEFAEWVELEGYRIKGMDDTQRQLLYKQFLDAKIYKQLFKK